MKATNAKTKGRPKKASDTVKKSTRQKSAASAKTNVTKTAVAKKTVRKASATKNMPSEDLIRQKAHELYLQRVARGESGNEADDWNNAIDLLRD